MTRKLAVSEITTRRWTFEEDVRGYVDAGIEGIGVWWDKLNAYGVDRGVELLQQSGLDVASLIYVGHFTHDEQSRSDIPACIDDPVYGIELAARMDAESLLVVPGPRIPGRTYGESLDILRRELEQLIPMAESHQVLLGIEPHHPMYTSDFSFMNQLDEGLEIIEEFNSPYFGLFIDVYHCWWDRNVYDHIERAAGKIFAVHLNDWREPTRDVFADRALMGDGVIDLPRLLSAIEDAGFDGWYEVEIMSDEHWRRPYDEYLRDIQQRFDALWRP